MMPDPSALVVSVTSEDIRNGQRREVCSCPVARAVCRALGVALADQEVSVENHIEVWTGDGWDGYRLPPEIIAWIDAFDAGEVVTPVTFTATYTGFLGEAE